MAEHMADMKRSETQRISDVPKPLRKRIALAADDAACPQPSRQMREQVGDALLQPSISPTP
jgi:hypothetical protein